MTYPYANHDATEAPCTTERWNRIDDSTFDQIQHDVFNDDDEQNGGIPRSSFSSASRWSEDDDDDDDDVDTFLGSSSHHDSPVMSRRKAVLSAIDEIVDVNRSSPPSKTIKRIAGVTTEQPSSVRIRYLTVFGHCTRSVLLDMPLMVLFSLWVVSLTIHYIHNVYLFKQIQLMGSFMYDKRDLTDATYYQRVCTREDVSTTSLADLTIASSVHPSYHRQNIQDAVEKILTHGAIVFPEPLISHETATAVRDYILSETKDHPLRVDTLESSNRYCYPLDISMDQSLPKVWKELANHRTFIDALEEIVGKDPIVVEFTSITSSYGAKSQNNHADVSDKAGATNYARTFWASYTLFIPLQDTTEKMGPTSICPGTHLCTSSAFKACDQGGDVLLSGSGGGRNKSLTSTNTTLKSDANDNGINVWKQGTGLLWNRQLTHKGIGHEQEGGPDRVMLIISFAPRPQTHRLLDTRMAPMSK
jgi:hypothetical protein